jgi:glutathione S-transferase
MAVPALVIEEGRLALFQSVAILEWLEETRLNPRCSRPIR